jgi:hypothetical protein
MVLTSSLVTEHTRENPGFASEELDVVRFEGSKMILLDGTVSIECHTAQMDFPWLGGASSSRLGASATLAKPQANFGLIFGEILADLRQLKRAENRSVWLTLKEKPKTLLKKVFRRSALRNAIEFGFRDPDAMMCDDGTTDFDCPFVAGRMLDFNHASYCRRWPGIFKLLEVPGNCRTKVRQGQSLAASCHSAVFNLVIEP